MFKAIAAATKPRLAFEAEEFDLTLLRGTRKQREHSAAAKSNRVTLTSLW